MDGQYRFNQPDTKLIYPRGILRRGARRPRAMNSSSRVFWARRGALVVILMAAAGAASAGTIVPCNGSCTWSIDVDGAEVQTGVFTVDPTTGQIDLSAPVVVTFDDGSSVTLGSL